MKNTYFCFLVFSLFLLTGCQLEYAVVGKFDDFNEVFFGTIIHDPTTGTAQVSVKTENSGFTCQGHTYVTYIPGNFTVKGQRGNVEMTCSDGRKAKGTWHAQSLKKGFGSGTDDKGNEFNFFYGMTIEQARIELENLKPTVADKPKLPVYEPAKHRELKGYSTGTGFFVSKEGHIVTNYHVVEGADEISVKLNGSAPLTATILSMDPANDVALLKVDTISKPLTIATQAIRRGEEVFSLGYPLVQLTGQEQKASFGHINALSGFQDDIRFLQIDVPTQPGNSGGPLFNKCGEVIGVVTATLDQLKTLSATGTLPQNINYATKIDYVLPLLKSTMPHINPLTGCTASTAELIDAFTDSVVLVISK